MALRLLVFVLQPLLQSLPGCIFDSHVFTVNAQESCVCWPLSITGLIRHDYCLNFQSYKGSPRTSMLVSALYRVFRRTVAAS